MGNQEVTPRALPPICPVCGAIDKKVIDEETHSPLKAEVCSECGYIYDFIFE